MTLLLLVLLAIAASGVGLAVMLRTDGYGHLPAPRSHVDDLPVRGGGRLV